MNKKFISIFLAVVILVGALLLVKNTEKEVLVDDEVTVTEPEQENNHDLITVTKPVAGEVVGNPIMVTGEARGYWFFEASFPIVVTDWNGVIIGEGYAQAEDDWMTEEFVPFVGTVNYNLPVDTPYKRGFLILKKDNPSGLPENDDAIEVPINF